VRDFSRELLLQGRENTNTPLIANNIRGLPGVRSMLAYESARVERSRNAMRFISVRSRLFVVQGDSRRFGSW
jgi:hypothetical protein